MPGNDNLASDRFLIVCGDDEVLKRNPTHNHENNSRCESTNLGSELLNSEMSFLYRVDVGYSLVSTFQIPIASFEEQCPNCGENSLKEHVPTDTMNIPEQWKLFSVSFPCEVSNGKNSEQNEAQSTNEFKAEQGGGGGGIGGGGETGDQDGVSTAMASVLVMSSRTAKQSSLVLIKQSGLICMISYKSVFVYFALCPSVLSCVRVCFMFYHVAVSCVRVAVNSLMCV